jgi:hypothetical protein
MHKSTAGSAQMRRVSVDMENASAHDVPVSPCQERLRAIGEPEAVKGVEQSRW